MEENLLPMSRLWISTIKEVKNEKAAKYGL